jgi:integrase
MVLVAYRHGLRASELVDLRWEQVAFKTATLHVRRVNQGTPSTHPILGDELRTLPGGYGQIHESSFHLPELQCSLSSRQSRSRSGDYR